MKILKDPNAYSEYKRCDILSILQVGFNVYPHLNLLIPNQTHLHKYFSINNAQTRQGVRPLVSIFPEKKNFASVRRTSPLFHHRSETPPCPSYIVGRSSNGVNDLRFCLHCIIIEHNYPRARHTIKTWWCHLISKKFPTIGVVLLKAMSEPTQELKKLAAARAVNGRHKDVCSNIALQ